MNDPESPKTSGPPRTRGVREIRAEGLHLNRQVLHPAGRFIYSETASGALLLVCVIVALAWANSPWSQSYFALRDPPVSFRTGPFSLALDLHHWIHDGVRAAFFFLVALEIKRERVAGDLSDIRGAALPVVAWIKADRENAERLTNFAHSPNYREGRLIHE